MKNKVTIIVPIYNVEQYLRKCVESLINQTYKKIEILLVDDGSPDNSASICDEYALKDKRVKAIHKENGGYGSVLEYAINNTKSEYFLICDPDDWLEKNAVEELVNAMVKYDTDLVVGRKKMIYSDGEIKSDLSEFSNLKSEMLYKNLYLYLSIPCSPHAKLYKTKLCKNISFPKKINNTDFLLYNVYLSRITSAVYIDKEIAYYFIDRPGNSFNEDMALSEKSLKSNAIVTEETLKQMNKESEIYDFSIISLFMRSCVYLTRMKKYKIEIKEYEEIFNNVIDYSKRYKRKLFKYVKDTVRSKKNVLFKYFIYNLFFYKSLRKIAIKLLSFVIN